MSLAKEKGFKNCQEHTVTSVTILEEPTKMKYFNSSSPSSSSSSLFSSSLPSPSPSRIFNNKTIFALVFFIVIYGGYLISSKILEKHINEYTKQRYWYAFNEGPCSQDKKYLQEMADLVVDASNVLERLGSNPVACYGTLLGVLRRGGVLPWDNNINLCVVNQIPKDFDTIRQIFSQFEINIETYDKWKGDYRFARNNIEGFITVFSKCSILDSIRFSGAENDYVMETESLKEKYTSAKSNSKLCPDGILPYLAQFIQGHTKPIPSQLLSPPFPTLHIGDQHKNKTIAVPVGDMEIVKYLYPSSWWLSVKPRGCH